VLAAGEGPVQVTRWAGTLVAWADDAGVRVYDTAVHQHSAFLDRPRSACARPPARRRPAPPAPDGLVYSNTSCVSSSFLGSSTRPA